ncbi:MAG: sigma-70 family RNA polymerase sigma factor [Chromatiales bacterium]|nr:MAG: sigma-70 family RNA polymerase sigma factor [Chromatiales bacterium]
MSDEQPILERVASGDQAAVGDFLSRYGDLVWSLARRYLGNHMEAEDAVQEIFIEIWNNAGRYDRNVASEVAFISTITRRRLIDRLRQFNRRPGMESIDEQVGASQPAVPTTLDDDAEVAQVERVLSDMDPKHREILSMSLYEGYSHSEIAETLEMPLGTVKTRVRRGLMHVREQLKLAEELDNPAEGTTG